MSQVDSLRASLVAVEENATALRLELEVERLGRVNAEKSAMQACEKEDIARMHHDKETAKLMNELTGLKKASEEREVALKASLDHGAKARVAKAEAETDKLKQDREAMIKEHLLEVADLNLHLSKKEAELVRLHSQVEDSSKKQAGLQKLVGELQLSQEDHRSKVNELKLQLAKLEESASKLPGLQTELAVRQSEVEDLKAQLVKAESELREAHKNAFDSQESISRLKTQISKLELDLQAACKSASEAAVASDHQISELKRDIDMEKKIAVECKNASGQSASALVDVMADLQAELDVCRKERDDAVKEGKEINSKLEAELVKLRNDSEKEKNELIEKTCKQKNILLFVFLVPFFFLFM